MKKLFVAIFIAWTVVYVIDGAWLNDFSLHLDFDDHSIDMAEWLVGGVVLAIVFVALAAVLATGIIALFFVAALAAIFAMVIAGFSAVWPILIGAALYFACRDTPDSNKLAG
jgi:hypothetical protein